MTPLLTTEELPDLLSCFFEELRPELELFYSSQNHVDKTIDGLTGWESWLKFELFLYVTKHQVYKNVKIELEKPINGHKVDIVLQSDYLIELKRRTHAKYLKKGIEKDLDIYKKNQPGNYKNVYFVGICKEPCGNIFDRNLEIVKESAEIGKTGYHWIVLRKVAGNR